MLASIAAIAAEWMVFLGVLVYVFDRDGSTATGLASITLLLTYTVAGSFTGPLVTRFHPQTVRVVGLIVQAAGYALAAAAAVGGLPSPYVIAPAALATGAVTSLRPSAARVLPGLVRTSRELTVGNVWNGYCETSAALAGPALGTGLLALGGAPAALTGCAVLAAIAVAVSLLPRPISPLTRPDAVASRRPLSVAAEALGELRRRPGATAVLVVAGAQFMVVGAFDIIVVVAAERDLGLGDAGPGWLLTAVGIGGIMSGPIAEAMARRRRQASALVVAMAVVAAASVVLAGSLTVAVAFVAFPLIGLSRSLIDVLADLVLHRAAPPGALGAVYSLLEVASGVGLIVGSLTAQLAIAAGGTPAALATIGVFFGLVAAIAGPRLRRADESADIPVVAMAALDDVPVFRPLHQTVLEDVARAAEEITVPRGTDVITEGDHGDRFYVVTDGEFRVHRDGTELSRVGRGGSFGEIALLADVPRTASVTAIVDAAVLSIERAPFLVAVTGDDLVADAAYEHLASRYEGMVPGDLRRPDPDRDR